MPTSYHDTAAKPQAACGPPGSAASRKGAGRGGNPEARARPLPETDEPQSPATQEPFEVQLARELSKGLQAAGRLLAARNSGGSRNLATNVNTR